MSDEEIIKEISSLRIIEDIILKRVDDKKSVEVERWVRFYMKKAMIIADNLEKSDDYLLKCYFYTSFDPISLAARVLSRRAFIWFISKKKNRKQH